MSKLYYRLNSLCIFLKQEKLIDSYDISHFKFEIDEKKLAYDYNTLRLKFENDNKIFEKYKYFFLLQMRHQIKFSLINTSHLQMNMKKNAKKLEMNQKTGRKKILIENSLNTYYTEKHLKN